MSDCKTNAFDAAAARWDAEPRRIELARAVGETVLRHVRPTAEMDVLDYGCGTGLLGLFLLPHVRSVTGTDSSPGMLRVLEEKIRAGKLRQMQTQQLDLARDAVPEARYHLIVSNMVMHHIEAIDGVLAAFRQVLLPGGLVAIADLDEEPGVFHGPEVAESVFHHGFERRAFADRLERAGFADVRHTTAHVIRKPIAGGEVREFPVFLMIGRRG